MLTLALATAAWAHDPIGSIGVRPLFDGEHLVGAHTTWGLVLADGDRWLRVCEEALPGLRDAWRFPSGEVWVATSDGLQRAVDGACATEPVPSDLGLVLGFVPNGDTLFLHATSGVFRADAAQAPTACAALPGPVDDLALGADGTLWAAGSEGAVWLRASDDGCGSWSEVLFPEPDATFLELHGPGLGGVLHSTWRADGSSGIWVLSPSGPTALVDLPSPPTAIACLADLCLVSSNRVLLSRFDPADGAATLTEVAEGPAACLWTHQATLWACTDVDEPEHLWSTVDGVDWAPWLPRDAVDERPCGPESLGATACDYGEDTGPRDTARGPGTIELVDDDRGCGCQSIGPTSGSPFARRR